MELAAQAPVAGPESASIAGSPKDKRRSFAHYGARYGMLIAFCIMLLVFLATNPDFRRPNNLLNILQQSSLIGIVSCGMVVIIISGGFDLSVGVIGAGSAISAASLMVGTGSILYGVLGGLAVGLIAGAFNGILVSQVKITPFVATLGSSTLMSGIIFASTNALPVSGIPPEFTDFGLGKIGGIPFPGIVFAAVAALTFIVLKWTRIGHYVYAVGSSSEASRLAGVPVERVVLFSFVLGGLLAGLAGVMFLGQTGIGQPTGGRDWPLTAIAAVVVGGTPLRGGSGGVHSAVVGTLLLGVLANALNLYGVSAYWQPAVTGVVILLAVGAESYQRKLIGDAV